MGQQLYKGHVGHRSVHWWVVGHKIRPVIGCEPGYRAIVYAKRYRECKRWPSVVQYHRPLSTTAQMMMMMTMTKLFHPETWSWHRTRWRDRWIQRSTRPDPRDDRAASVWTTSVLISVRPLQHANVAIGSHHRQLDKKASIRWQDSARRQFQAQLRGDEGL